jgi:hypothetical protein
MESDAIKSSQLPLKYEIRLELVPALSFLLAPFSNFVAIDYNIGLNYLSFFSKLTLIMRKEFANLVPTFKMAFITLKSVFGF